MSSDYEGQWPRLPPPTIIHIHQHGCKQFLQRPNPTFVSPDTARITGDVVGFYFQNKSTTSHLITFFFKWLFNEGRERWSITIEMFSIFCWRPVSSAAQHFLKLGDFLNCFYYNLRHIVAIFYLKKKFYYHNFPRKVHIQPGDWN